MKIIRLLQCYCKIFLSPRLPFPVGVLPFAKAFESTSYETRQNGSRRPNHTIARATHAKRRMLTDGVGKMCSVFRLPGFYAPIQKFTRRSWHVKESRQTVRPRKNKIKRKKRRRSASFLSSMINPRFDPAYSSVTPAALQAATVWSSQTEACTWPICTLSNTNMHRRD